jgi:simple sugar transport system permease protein
MLGRTIYALGGNPVAARRVGFRVLLIQLFVYGYMGLLAGVAGIVHALNVQTVAPNALVGRELGVFAAVVLGGATLSGGVGTLRGTVVGVALVAVVSNGLTLTRVPAVWNQVAIGLIILISVTVTACRSFAGRSGETAR